MKLLFLTPQPPYPLDQGTKLRNYHLIRIAAEAGHHVDLLTFVGRWPSPETDLLTPEQRQALECWCRRVVAVPAPPPRPMAQRGLSTLRSSMPDLLLRLRSRRFLQRLQQLLAEAHYDAVQVEGLELSPYLSAVHGSQTIFDDHNVEFLLQQRAWQTDRRRPRRAHAALYSLIQWRRLRRWEARVCRAADAVLAVSERDAAVLGALSGRRITTVLNGIDLSSYPFRPRDEPIVTDLLFDGTMSFRPNDDAALWLGREILPLIRRERPEVRLWVVGRDPSPAVVALNYGSNGVAVTGAVESTAPYWERAGVYLLPMRMGGGSRFKALEAMARGVPLVSTALGMEGTPAEAGRDYLRAEQPGEFAAAASRLLGEPGLRRQLAERARATVAAHNWAQVAPRLLEVYQRLEGDAPKGSHAGGGTAGRRP